MSEEAWWGREAGPGGVARMVPAAGPAAQQPELVTATAPDVRALVRSRIPGFTPDWSNPDRADAGVALVRLFGLLMEPVLRRVNRLPEKALVEHLRVAGVRGLPATPASALLEFTVSPAAGGSVSVPQGFQAGAPPATGQGDEVVFETEGRLDANPSSVAAVAVEENGVVSEANLGGGAPVRPFGARPRPGNALWIALSIVDGVASPSPSLSLGLVAAGGTPAPAVSTATGQPAVVPQPLTAWELLDGDRLVPVAVTRDETGGLRRTGIVELAMPDDWQPGRPPGGSSLEELRWLRVRFVNGSYPAPPSLVDVRANMVRATAVRTIRDEPLQPLDTDADGRTRMTVSQSPVVPGSLVVEVDNDPVGDLFGTGTGTGPASRWKEVDNLAAYGPDDRVFVLDPSTGTVTFGDGVHGARVPDGFRNVRAAVYSTGGGRAGAVRAKAIQAPLTAVAFVTGVTNPFPASGGVDAEPSADTVRRGGQELRARDRAVAPPDYGVLALRSPGAQVARAQAVVGRHPDYPGRPIPGLVGVIVVPPADEAHTAGGPPVPTGEELRAVADYLSRVAAPAGVQVVASAPVYHRVGVEAWLVLDPDEDQADVLRRAADTLTAYLDPIRGGADGTGWPFGAPLRHVGLVRRLLAVPGVLAIPQVNVVLDGRRRPPCTDTPISAHGLVFADRHELIPVPGGGGP
jgi:predicted phage baseplate assembly protein